MVVAQHSRHIQAFDDEPVVVFDQLVGELMSEMTTDVSDAVMMSRQSHGGSAVFGRPAQFA